jgi:hypothetical protein
MSVSHGWFKWLQMAEKLHSLGQGLHSVNNGIGNQWGRIAPAMGTAPALRAIEEEAKFKSRKQTHISKARSQFIISFSHGCSASPAAILRGK